MAFPTNPVSGTTHENNDRAWLFNGYAWERYDPTPNEVYTINGITGDIGLSAGNGITLSVSGKTFTISSLVSVAGITGSIQYKDGGGLSGNSQMYFDGTNLVLVNPTHLDGDILGGVHHYAHNNSGVGITKGWPVYITGMDGASTIFRIAGADASISSKMPAVGLAESTIANGDFGHVLMFGTLLQVDTSAYATNQTLYVSPGGGLTGIRPTESENLIQNIGKVGRVHSNTGSLVVMGPGRSNDVPNIVDVRSWLLMPNGQTATSIVTTFNGLCGAVTGVSSVNGMTGAVTNIFAAGVTITNTNSSATWYPTFVGGTGATAFYIDAVTTPLSYQPSTGTINGRIFNGTFGSNTAKLDGQVGVIFVDDGTDSILVNTSSLAKSGPASLTVSGNGLIFEGNNGIQFTDNSASPTWSYTFPQSNGTTGQVLTTNGAGTLSWENSSLVSFASSDVSLADVNTAQNVFTSASDTVSLKANTTYIMKGQYIIQSGTTTHTTAVSFLYGGGVTASMSFSSLNVAAALGTVSRAQDMVHFDSISGGVINSTSASARNTIVLEGMVKTDASTGCTLTPQITFSAAPGGTNLTKFGSYISFTPVGTSTATSIGTWS